MEGTILEMDVREDLKNKQEPFQKIMAAIANLQSKDIFLLHAPFEPIPLYGVLASQGFEYTAEKVSEDYWKITFTKK
ncbi:DUF2249 domain-containing protein [Bacillus marasmi]|uniref:DUF2249 domain-containing protein n=1 Tax=Bacillus marasmi TaxID=1926279 RepID=UPI0011C72F0D|nr:DUF2249 domain-containing protein [Bacillus marasmi]